MPSEFLRFVPERKHRKEREILRKIEKDELGICLSY